MISTVRWIHLHKAASWLWEYTCDFAARVVCVFYTIGVILGSRVSRRRPTFVSVSLSPYAGMLRIFDERKKYASSAARLQHSASSLTNAYKFASTSDSWFGMQLFSNTVNITI